jgi:surfeit locus 1 family protein
MKIANFIALVSPSILCQDRAWKGKSPMTLQKPPFIASCFMLAGLAVLLALGTWQYQRLQWKQGWITEIEAAYSAAQDTALSGEDFRQAITEGRRFLAGNIYGDFLFSRELYVGIRTDEGTPGYHLITPFQMEDGTVILVNRGWVPLDQRGEVRSIAVTNITGYARPPQDSAMAPENDVAADQWYRTDIEQIAHAKGLQNVLPYIFYAQSESGAENVKPHAQGWYPKNSHFSYMLFWYALALTMLVVFFFRFVKK